MLILYSLTLFLSATLLFTVEPMVGKMLLPRCGGTPSVWNTCMVFFQAVLLLGYGYAHLSTVYLGVRRQAILHLFVILLPFLVLPVFFAADNNPPPDGNPSFWLLARLTIVVGLPFFILSTTAPLLQKWFANTGHSAAHDPYFLYSTSNAGSLIALLAYPFLIEPSIGLLSQSHVWHIGYACLVALIICCAIVLWRASKKASQVVSIAPQADEINPAAKQESPITLGQRMKWIFLAFVPSSLMLGATTHIATDIASVPLLWVIPLALYLLTFIIVFARKPIIPHSWMVLAMAFAVLLMPLMIVEIPSKFWMAVGVHLLTFFIIAMVCHGEMARSRPSASRLTEFYFLMSVGGVLGGLFNSIVAPQLFGSVRLFSSVIEYPLMLAAACLLMPSDKKEAKHGAFDALDFAWLIGLLVVIGVGAGISAMISQMAWKSPIKPEIVIAALYGLPALLCFSFKGRPARFALGVAMLFLLMDYKSRMESGKDLIVMRDFFGVNRVRIGEIDKKPKFHMLVNGNTIHGLQRWFPEPSCEPTGYYCKSGPLGDVFDAFSGPMLKRRVGVIGLGSGGMAAYAMPEQHFTFYEIDPVVVQIASDPKLFTYLKDCRGKCDIDLGDARLRLAKAADGEFDMIVLDAFSSDSIPIHLLTQESLQLYLAKLKPDGVMVLHISNRYLRLAPVLGRLAAANNLVCRSRFDDKDDFNIGKRASQYMVMARSADELGDLAHNELWKEVEFKENARAWTDDYSDILSVLKW